MDLVKITKPKNILQKVKKAGLVKAQIKTSIENDANKAILSKGEEVVSPVCTRVLKEKVNYFSLFLQHVWVCVVGGRSTASENEWVSTGKGKGNAGQSKS